MTDEERLEKFVEDVLVFVNTWQYEHGPVPWAWQAVAFKNFSMEAGRRAEASNRTGGRQ